VRPEEVFALLRTYFDKQQSQFPVSIIRERKDKHDTKRIECCLDTIGSSRAIADATVIKTAYEIIREEYGNIEIELNSFGDRESLARFGRELTAYFRKHINDLHPECRQLLKKSAFATILCRA
jgi:histidyl-tRNA synthetase